MGALTIADWVIWVGVASYLIGCGFCAYIASEKGRPGGEWFITAVFVSPLLALIGLNVLSNASQKPTAALKTKANSREALINKGASLSALGRPEEAIVLFDVLLKIEPDNADALYGKACAYALMPNKPKMLEFLNAAIAFYPTHRGKAKTDSDFKNYWDDPDFIALVSEPPKEEPPTAPKP
jgi:tetratricopeptide (TPR) repeat protein